MYTQTDIRTYVCTYTMQRVLYQWEPKQGILLRSCILLSSATNLKNTFCCYIDTIIIYIQWHQGTGVAPPGDEMLKLAIVSGASTILCILLSSTLPKVEQRHCMLKAISFLKLHTYSGYAWVLLPTYVSCYLPLCLKQSKGTNRPFLSQSYIHIADMHGYCYLPMHPVIFHSA